MKELVVANIILNLEENGADVRLTSAHHNVLFPNQDAETIARHVTANFEVVFSYYNPKGRQVSVPEADVAAVSLKIVLHYLYIYNLWRTQYKNGGNRSLAFDVKDFKHPGTHDELFWYFKETHPRRWQEYCAALMDMDTEQLQRYYELREQYYNK